MRPRTTCPVRERKGAAAGGLVEIGTVTINAGQVEARRKMERDPN